MSEPSEAKTTRPEAKTTRLMLAYLCIAKEAEASLEGKVEILDRFELGWPERTHGERRELTKTLGCLPFRLHPGNQGFRLCGCPPYQPGKS